MSIVSGVLDCYDEGKGSCPQCGTAPNALEYDDGDAWALCEACRIGWLRYGPSCDWLEAQLAREDFDKLQGVTESGLLSGEPHREAILVERARREECLNALRPGHIYADRSGGIPEWVKDVMERHYGIRPF